MYIYYYAELGPSINCNHTTKYSITCGRLHMPANLSEFCKANSPYMYIGAFASERTYSVRVYWTLCKANTKVNPEQHPR